MVDPKEWPARGVSPGGAREAGSRDVGKRPVWYPVLAAGIMLWCSGLIFAPVLAAGMGTNVDSAPVRSLLEMRRESVIVQEFDVSCGAAALATLLTYQHGDPVSEQEVARGLIQRQEYLANPELLIFNQGFSLLDLKRYVERRGYEGTSYGKMEFGDLVERAPIMTPVSFNGYNHFVIFRGVVGDNRVLLVDPAWGNRTMPIEKFEDSWLEYPEFGKVGFVVTRRDGAAPPNRLAPRLGDVPELPDIALRQAIMSVLP